MWTSVNPQDGTKPGGSYSPGVRAGDWLFVSGQGPIDPVTGAVVEGGVAAQVRATLANIERIVRAAGGSLADVVRVDAYLSDIGHFDEYDRAYREVFGERLPARTTVGGQLAGIDVEINAIAYLGTKVT